MVAWAYIVGPFAGLNVWWIVISIPALLTGFYDPQSALSAWFVTMLVGGVVCLAVELCVITPLLIAFSRYRWGWFNGWSLAAIGFLLGAAPWLVLLRSIPVPSTDQLQGSVTTCSHGRCSAQTWAQAGLGPSPPSSSVVWEVHGHWTAAGWALVVAYVMISGAVGLIAAVVFRLIAVHSVRQTEACD